MSVMSQQALQVLDLVALRARNKQSTLVPLAANLSTSCVTAFSHHLPGLPLLHPLYMLALI